MRRSKRITDKRENIIVPSLLWPHTLERKVLFFIIVFKKKIHMIIIEEFFHFYSFSLHLRLWIYTDDPGFNHRIIRQLYFRLRINDEFKRKWRNMLFCMSECECGCQWEVGGQVRVWMMERWANGGKGWKMNLKMITVKDFSFFF